MCEKDRMRERSSRKGTRQICVLKEKCHKNKRNTIKIHNSHMETLFMISHLQNAPNKNMKENEMK